MTEAPQISRRAALGLGGAVLVGGALRYGGGDATASGDEVHQAKQRLNKLGYWCGPPSADVDDLTVCAVLAFQKTHGLRLDGLLDEGVIKALREKGRPRRFTQQGRALEVDVEQQVLRLVDDGRILLTLHASTGSGAARRAGSRTVLDETPRGRFRLRQAEAGATKNALGPQYRPHPFLGPYALYGRSTMGEVRAPSTAGGIALPRQAVDLLAARGSLRPGRLVVIQ